MADIRDEIEGIFDDPAEPEYTIADLLSEKAIDQLEQLIKERQVEARLKERKRMSQDLEEFSDWAFVNYPHHELEKAIKGFWRENADRIAELEEDSSYGG